MIAALYVDPRGTYADLPGVEPWGLPDRDARDYAGPHPVVAHPPCARWCVLAQQVESMGGARVGDDGGCFAAALASVREFGGVLEHPQRSLAWKRFGLPRARRGGWSRQLFGDPGWSCEVAQVAYGHLARKRTWLYYVGSAAPPPLDWSEPPAAYVVGTSRRVHGGSLQEIPKSHRKATPPAFRDVLISVARSAGAS